MDRTEPHTANKLPHYIIYCSSAAHKRYAAAHRAAFCEQYPQEDIKIVVVDDNYRLSDIPNAPLSRVYFLNPRNFDLTITKSEEIELQELPEDYFWRVHHSRKSPTKTGKRQAHSPIFFRQKRPFTKKHDSR